LRYKVALIPDINTSSFILPLPEILNNSQESFEFIIIDELNKNSELFPKEPIDIYDIFPQINLEKKAYHLRKDDLLIRFINNTLESKTHSLTNLFIAGSSINESPPRVAAISTSFIRKHILPVDPTYNIQKHAFYHLVICCLLGAFLEMGAHEDRGCLLDFNNYTPNFSRKIQAGYSFCESCELIVRRHHLGKAIMQICGALKTRTVISLKQHFDISKRKNIFLCYAGEDRPKVEKLYNQLKNEGFNPWMDKKDIIPGQDWQLEIKKAITKADYFIACLSNSFKNRTYGHKEIKIALNVLDTLPEGHIYLIPARLEECQVEDRLSDRQWVDLYDQNGFEFLMKALRWNEKC
jgi:hypothetical protein